MDIALSPPAVVAPATLSTENSFATGTVYNNTITETLTANYAVANTFSPAGSFDEFISEIIIVTSAVVLGAAPNPPITASVVESLLVLDAVTATNINPVPVNADTPLAEYLQKTQLLLNDLSESNYNIGDLIQYINEARRQIAGEAQCCRIFVNTITTVANQEVYFFSNVDLSAHPGAGSVLAVLSVALLWGDLRYVIRRVGFSQYQARIRTYNGTFTDVPTFGAQYGQGVQGSFYLYPVPSQIYTMEWDCLCLPADLVNTTSVELIPHPWRIAVPYFAAMRAAEGAEAFDKAQYYSNQFTRFMKRSRAQATPGYTSNWYGRG